MGMDFKKSLGAAIRRWREQKGMSQEELAKAAGDLDKQTIYRLEKGRVWPEYESLEKICNVLGVSLEDEVGVPNPPPPAKKSAKLELFELVASLDDKLAATALPGIQAIIEGLLPPGGSKNLRKKRDQLLD